MKTISPEELLQVIGAAAATSTNPTLGTNGTNDPVFAALASIQNSIKELGNRNNSMFGGQNGMMFMMMALAMSRRNETVVYPGGYYSGWY